MSQKPTKAQAARMSALARMPCICCELEGLPSLQPFRTEVHHVVDCGYRKHSGGHDSTLPICGWHHRGRMTEGMSEESMRMLHGPSLALTKRSFKAKYGTERELLVLVDRKLSERAAA